MRSNACAESRKRAFAYGGSCASAATPSTLSITLRAAGELLTLLTICTTTGMVARRPTRSVLVSSRSRDLGLPVAEVDGLRAEHQMREIDVPRMRRNVRALRHVADVAEVALVDDLRVVVLRDAVDFQRRRRVDEIEQRRERLAQAHAPAAAVADVEDALHLLLERLRVVERRVAPRDGMPCRCLEVAFAVAHRRGNIRRIDGRALQRKRAPHARRELHVAAAAPPR